MRAWDEEDLRYGRMEIKGRGEGRDAGANLSCFQLIELYRCAEFRAPCSCLPLINLFLLLWQSSLCPPFSLSPPVSLHSSDVIGLTYYEWLQYYHILSSLIKLNLVDISERQSAQPSCLLWQLKSVSRLLFCRMKYSDHTIFSCHIMKSNLGADDES